MENENLKIYNEVRTVPQEAQKSIRGGRLKGMTDINPMWRIKKLTEVFGMCGVGWYYTIVEKWIETTMAKDEITANIMIHLFVKTKEGWSQPIVGIGGSMLVASERNGLYVNDECYKMALTDAISVACKALGMGADIYWGNDNTKYNDTKKNNMEPVQKASEPEIDMTPVFTPWRDKVYEYCISNGITHKELAKDYGLNKSTTEERFKEVYEDLTNEKHTAK